MVLQGAPRKALIWGSAPENTNGEEVTLTLDGKTYSTSAVTEEGTWSFNIGMVLIFKPSFLQFTAYPLMSNSFTRLQHKYIPGLSTRFEARDDV